MKSDEEMSGSTSEENKLSVRNVVKQLWHSKMDVQRTWKKSLRPSGNRKSDRRFRQSPSFYGACRSNYHRAPNRMSQFRHLMGKTKIFYAGVNRWAFRPLASRSRAYIDSFQRCMWKILVKSNSR